MPAALALGTVALNQIRGGPGRKTKSGPTGHRIAGLDWKANDTHGDEVVKPRPAARAGCPHRRAEFGNDPPVHGHGNAFARLNPTDVLTQIVLELSDACGCHVSHYSYM